MKGKVLGFDPASGTGAINGDDGKRYKFTTTDNKSPQPLKPNDLSTSKSMATTRRTSTP